MKLAYIIISVLFLNCSIASVKEGETKIVERFQKTFKNSKYSKTATLLVHSDRLKIHVKSSAGILEDQKSQVTPNQPFHTASIGKIFTSVLIHQFIESGKLSLNDSVQKILGADVLKNLFVYEGIDHSEKVTISHLLTHTSGVDDYFDSVDKKNKSVIDEIITNPDKFWTPIDLVNFTRTNQRAIAPPGAKFHYSDTGYILLGLIIEKITAKKLEVVLQEKIFTPLVMKNTYMYLRSEPSDKIKLPVSTMMLRDKNVTGFKSLSADWVQQQKIYSFFTKRLLKEN